MNITTTKLHTPHSRCTVLALEHLDGSNITRGYFWDYIGFGWQWVEEKVREQFDADAFADIGCVESPDGGADLITLNGTPVARCYLVDALH